MLELCAWRQPLALAAAVLAINVAALNIDWWRMKAEANSLRASMTQTYKSALPKETVIIDPVAQMWQKIAAPCKMPGCRQRMILRRSQLLGEAWAGVAAAGKSAPLPCRISRTQPARALEALHRPGQCAR